MPQREPLDFLLARAERISRAAEQLLRENRACRERSARVTGDANAAVLRAHIYAAYAKDLVAQSRLLCPNKPAVTLDEAARARLARDELWRWRLAKRLRERNSG